MTMTADGVVKLIEECGELTQVLAKRLAWWSTDEPHWDGSDLKTRMAEEMGDVMAGLIFVAGQFDISDAMMDRSAVKFETYCDWHEEQGNNAHGIDALERPYDYLIGRSVRTSDLTIHPCGAHRASGCPHEECQPADADFGAQGEVVATHLDANGTWWLDFDWGYSLIVTNSTKITAAE